MTRRLYTIPVPTRAGDQTTTQIAQQLAEQGLLQQDTQAVDKIALGESTHRITGRFDWGELLSTRAGRQIQSLGESSFGAVPLFGDGGDSEVTEPAYYEVDNASANPAIEGFPQIWSYDVTLSKAGTQETVWRTLRTTRQDASNPFDAGGVPLLGVDVFATKTKWFSQSEGVEVADPVDNVETEYGTVELYNPANSTFDDPRLIFELPFAREGRTDVVVWDDRDRPKRVIQSDSNAQVGSATVATTTGGYGSAYGTNYGTGDTVETTGPTVGRTQATTVWEHVFHTGWEREGDFVVENGRLRVKFDEDRGLIRPFRWDESMGWQSVQIDHGDWELVDATPERINAVDAEFYCEFSDGSSTEAFYLSLQRGISDALIREPESVTLSQSLLDVIEPIALDWADDLAPSQGTQSRSEVEDV